MLVLMELLEDVSTPRVLPPLQFMCLSVGDDIVRDVMFNGWMLEITLLKLSLQIYFRVIILEPPVQLIKSILNT